MKITSAALFAVCAVSLAQASAEDTVIFSGEDRFRKGWTSSPWGGLEVGEGKGENDGAAVVTVVAEKATPWCGLNLHLAYDQSRVSGAIPVDDNLRQNGVVVLRLNCGKDRDGQPGAGQALQVSLSFLVDGKPVSAPAMPLSKFGGKAALDGDEATWEEVRVPIGLMAANLPNQVEPEGLLGVGIQYVENPACEVIVSDCRVQSE